MLIADHAAAHGAADSTAHHDAAHDKGEFKWFWMAELGF